MVVSISFTTRPGRTLFEVMWNRNQLYKRILAWEESVDVFGQQLDRVSREHENM